MHFLGHNLKLLLLLTLMNRQCENIVLEFLRAVLLLPHLGGREELGST